MLSTGIHSVHIYSSLLVAGLLALGGCAAVGPNYIKPTPSAPDA